MNRSTFRLLVVLMAVSVLLLAVGEHPSYAQATDRSCPQGESKTDAGCIKSPQLVQKVTPVYPDAARRAGEEGHVTLKTRVLKDGSVADVEVKKCTNPGHGFEAAAMDALKQWRYEPGTLNGKPAEVEFTVTIDFLHD